jgi:hypothetical protein
MGLLDLVYMILALRTNAVFFGIFLTLVCAFGLLTGSYFQAAKGNASVAYNCQVAAGAFTFVTIVLGWYLFFVIMLAALDFPFQLPGELCTFDRVWSALIVLQSAIFLDSSRVPAKRSDKRNTRFNNYMKWWMATEDPVATNQKATTAWTWARRKFGGLVSFSDTYHILMTGYTTI